MPSRIARSTTLGTLLALGGLPALAQAPAEGGSESSGAERPPAARNEVVVGVSGDFDAEARTTLARLLRAELEPHGLALVERDPSGDAREWAREVARDERHLLAVLLDTKGRAGWRLVVIDAARGRAISRELPRGERDAANVEAIVSIVASATNALREGLEVASAPLESVVDPGRSRPAPPSAPPPPEPPLLAKPEPSRGTSLHGSLSALTASFADEAEPTFGASLALGVSIGALVEVDVGGSRHLPATVESSFGRFALARTALGMSAGPVLESGSFVFVPALGATVEWITRTDTITAEGVTSGDEAESVPRAGVVFAARGRYRLLSNGESEFLSVAAEVGASYFGERVRFLAGDEVLAEARRSSFVGGLGLFIATGPL